MTIEEYKKAQELLLKLGIATDSLEKYKNVLINIIDLKSVTFDFDNGVEKYNIEVTSEDKPDDIMKVIISAKITELEENIIKWKKEFEEL